jgi:hypothetical protein
VIAKPDNYRARADESDQQARAARDPKVNSQFLELARHWRTLADQVDRQHR